MSKRNQTFIQIVFAIIAIQCLLMLLALSLSFPVVFGQAAQGGTGALRFVPQDAIVYTKAPPGWESNIGTGNELTNMIMAVAGSSTVTGIVNAAYTKLKGDKAVRKAESAQDQVQEMKPQIQETKQIVNEQAQTQVKLATVAQKSLELQYDTMGVDKANAIKDKPEIQLQKVVEIKEQALKTTAKASPTPTKA